MTLVTDPFENLATKTDLHLLEAKLLFSQGELKNDLISGWLAYRLFRLVFV